jgi:hypothetical protein
MWDSAGCFGGGDRGRNIGRKNHVNLPTDKVGHHTVVVAVQDCLPVFDEKILALDVSKLR